MLTLTLEANKNFRLISIQKLVAKTGLSEWQIAKRLALPVDMLNEMLDGRRPLSDGDIRMFNRLAEEVEQERWDNQARVWAQINRSRGTVR
jgi:predicted transcriptional regulator